MNALQRANITTLGQLLAFFGPHFRDLKNVGRRTYCEIKDFVDHLRGGAPLPPQDPLESFRSFLDSLPARDKDILCSRFGLLGRLFTTLHEVGSRYNITRERARQIANSRLRRLFRVLHHQHSAWFQNLDRILDREKVITLPALAEAVLHSCTPDDLSFLKVVLGSSPQEYVNLDTGLWGVRHKVTLRYNDILSIARDLLRHVGNGADVLSVETARRLNWRSPEDIAAIRRMLVLSPEFTFDGHSLFIAGETNVSMAMQRRNYAYEYLQRQGVPVHVREILQGLREECPELLGNVASDTLGRLRVNLERDAKFAWAGPGMFALVDWGYEGSVSCIGDAAYRLLRAEGRSMRTPEIERRILELYRVKRLSIRVALGLEKGKRFIRIAPGEWCAI